LLAVFWDFQRHILKHYMVRGIMVISVNYCDILGNELRLTVCTQWRGRLSWVVLVCDRVHLTFSSIQQLNWEVLKHLAHSPDLSGML
jgi:hypothetical protein